MNKAKANYLVDVGISLAGVVSAISGLVFVLPGDPTTGLLGVSYAVWNNLHTWSSLAAIAGVGAHTALHWKWIVAMTRQMLLPAVRRPVSEGVPGLAQAAASGDALSRRAFLALGGAATLVAGAVVAGYKVISANPAEASQSSSQIAATSQEGGVACPRGLINDPYPGRCHFYVDADGDGICDYSVPGSGSGIASSSFGGGFGRGSHPRPGSGQP